jgi:hypothetical protein
MLNRLLGRTPIEVWAVKQIDPDLLHLCGPALLKARPGRKAVLAALQDGSYVGPVEMADGGHVVLNAKLFAALVPQDDLHWLPDGHAHWQGRDWRVSRVPQRCWAYRGRLVAQASPLAEGGLASTEDVETIRRRVERETPHPPGQVVFRPENAGEDPLLESRQASRDRVIKGREWRRDDD